MKNATLSETLQEKGYLVRRQAIALEALDQTRTYLEGRLNDLCTQFQAWSGAKKVREIANYRDHSDKIAQYEAQGLPKDLRHFLRGEFDLQTRLSPEIQALMSAPSLQSAIAEVLGESHYFVHYPPMLRLKFPSAKQTLVPPHQDIAYNSHLNDFVSVWVPFVPIAEQVGGVIFYEGTQNLKSLAHRHSGAWESRADFEEFQYSTASPEMQLGDVLFFTPTIVHTSGLNLSQDIIRLSIDLRVFKATTVSPKPYYEPRSGKIYNAP